MKKSNLLLLGTFATFLLLLLGLHLMVAARFKSGQYKTLGDDAWMADFTWIPLPPVKVIEIENLTDVKVYSAERSKLGYKKANQINFRQQRNGDTLTVWSKQNDDQLVIYLDSATILKARVCEITYGGPNTTSPVVLNAILDKSGFGVNTGDSDSVSIDVLNIKAANASTINLSNGSVRRANITIADSRLIAEKADVKDMALQADDASQLQVSVKQLRSFQNKQ